MLPNFLCIGAQKSGTTTLWRILDAHPDVYMAHPRETRFFSDDAFFSEGPAKYEMTCFDGWRGQQAVGEKCPEYLWEPRAAQRILSVLGPEVRLIVALRSPAQRAHSHFRHNRARLRESRSFEEAFHASAGKAAIPAHFDYVGRGFYARQLGRFLEHFPATQIFAIHFEKEINSDQRALADRVYSFLGLKPHRPRAIPFHEGHPKEAELRDDEVRSPSPALRQFVRSYRANAPKAPLDRATELELNRRYFADDAEDLSKMFDFDTKGWFQ